MGRSPRPTLPNLTQPLGAMPLKIDEQMPRSFMLLCLGAAIVLLVGQLSGISKRLVPGPVGIVRAKKPLTALAQAQPTAPSAPVATPQSPQAAKTDRKLVVDLSDRQVTLYKNTEVVGRYPIAVAMAGWETPKGNFQVLNKETDPIWVHPITSETIPPGPDNPLGKAWIGFWTDGASEIGFHGTNQEELIGEAVSHGCLRLRNADITTIYAQVTEGTPVTVQP